MNDARIDDLDRRLIAELGADPRISYADLGKRLGVSGMTAATRLNRLRAARLLQIRAVPEFAQLGLGNEVQGFAQVEIAALPAITDLLARSPYVLRVSRVTGEFDLSFDAVFPSEIVLGELVRDLQALDGVRRIVIHHVLEQLKQEDGWGAVFADEQVPEDIAYELVPGTRVPKHLETRLNTAAAWVDALAKADLSRLRSLSDQSIVFEIMPPHAAAGVFDGMAAVERQAERTRRAYRRLWYRVIGVGEAHEPYALVIDALSPVEDHRGRVGTAFSRMAFGFSDGRIARVVSLGQADIADLPAPPIGAEQSA